MNCASDLLPLHKMHCEEIESQIQKKRYFMKCIFIVSVLFTAALLSMEGAATIERKRTADEGVQERTVKRNIEITAELIAQIQELVENNKFAEYFKLVGTFEYAVQKKIYELDLPKDKKDYKAIHWAAFHNNVQVIEELDQRDVSIDTPNKDHRTALSIAILHDQNEAAECLIELGADFVTEAAQSPVLLAAAKGNCAIMRLMHRVGISIDDPSKDKNKITPLHAAAKWGHLAMIQLLTQWGADIHARDSKGCTALHFAATKNKSDAIRLLCKLGLDPNVRSAQKNTPLHLAAENNHDESIRVLKELGASLEARNKFGKTPFMAAADSKQLKALGTLKELGADIQARDSKKATCLHAAAFREQLDVIECLVGLGANIEAQQADELTPLHIAVIKGKEESVKKLISLGANKEARDNQNKTPLMCAAEYQNLTMMKVLGELRADLTAQDKRGWTALHYAAAEDDVDGIRYLVRSGAKVQELSTAGSALHIAASNGCIKSVRVLKELGASIDTPDATGRTALHSAVISNQVDVIKILKELGADIELRTGTQMIPANATPLELALHFKKTAAAECLRNLGADIYAENENGLRLVDESMCLALMLRIEDTCGPNSRREKNNTLLLEAASKGFTFIVRRLLKDTRLEINAVNSDGNTALHLAAAGGHEAIVYMLLQDNRVERNRQNVQGNTAFHLAIETRRIKLIPLFLMFGVDCDYYPNRDGKTVRQLAQRFPDLAAELEKAQTAEAIEEIKKHMEVAIKAPPRPENAYDTAHKRLEDMFSPNVKRAAGMTLLMEIALAGDAYLLKKLLGNNSIQINNSDRFGATALHHAIRAGCKEVVELLLHDKRTDRYAQDVLGDTPFHAAVSSCDKGVSPSRRDIIALFLQLNTDYELPTNEESCTVISKIKELPTASQKLIQREFTHMEKIRIALEAWKKRHTGCINPLPDELCERFIAFAQDALRRK